MTHIWFNGDFYEDEKQLSLDDRGFLLGETLFETILIKQGRLQFWHEHIARLFHSCRHFDFACPYDEAILKDAAQKLIMQKKDAPRLALRLTTSRGAGGRGLTSTTRTPTPNWVIQINDAPPPRAYTKLFISDLCRLAQHESNRHKIGSYFDNISARKQALRAGAQEALLFNQYGRLACASAANIFLLLEDGLFTPPIAEGALGGIIRAQLVNKLGVAQERALDKTEIEKARGFFLTNSLIEIAPAGFADTLPEEITEQTRDLRETLNRLSA